MRLFSILKYGLPALCAESVGYMFSSQPRSRIREGTLEEGIIHIQWQGPYSRAVMLAVVLCLAAGSAAAQNLNPAYLKELPSVDRVMNDMKTSDPAETAARQMGALLQLKKMIEDAAGPRFFSRTTGLTPDETRLRQQYYTAYYQLSQSKPELKGLNALRGL